MTKTRWNDHAHEGKLIRKIINSLAKEIKDANLDEKVKILHAISQAANIKVTIDKHENLDYKIRLVLKLYKEQTPKKFTDNNYARELPGQRD